MPGLVRTVTEGWAAVLSRARRREDDGKIEEGQS
jgi:hypothetical protein